MSSVNILKGIAYSPPLLHLDQKLLRVGSAGLWCPLVLLYQAHRTFQAVLCAVSMLIRAGSAIILVVVLMLAQRVAGQTRHRREASSNAPGRP